MVRSRFSRPNILIIKNVYKVRFLNKWREENNQYSPTHEVKNIDTDRDLPSDEPSSPLSTYSLTFDGEK